jgi:hypothetical protein
MIQNFDYFGFPEIPYMILCTPSLEETCSIGLAYDTKLTLRYNAISDFTFTFPKSIDGGQTTLEQYELIKNKKIILIENHGYFIIDDVSEEMEGFSPIKNVSCKSIEYELVSKRISAYGGTVKLYSLTSPIDTLLYVFLQDVPNWTVGDIDADLLIKSRTFDISDTNIYNALMGEVATAFECVFSFDYLNKTISAKSYETATVQTDVYLSLDNLIENATFTEKTDEITTCLAVYGGGNLNIRGVNPLGTDKIYDFSYYMNNEWMSSGLITALTNWEILLASKQIDYSDNLLLLKDYNAELILLQSNFYDVDNPDSFPPKGLAQLNAEYLSLEGVQRVRVEAGEPYADILLLMSDKQVEIDERTSQIAGKQSQIDAMVIVLQGINNDVSFTNLDNFSPAQLLELNNFIFENTYKNENIIQTDLMSNVDIQEAQLELYLQGSNILSRVSQPRYEIEFSTINYLDLPQFSRFTQQTELGSSFFIEIEGRRINGVLVEHVEAVLLEMLIVFDDPTNMQMTFSNRLRLDNGEFVYSDLFGNVVKTGSKVAFDSVKWSNWENNYKNDVTDFITSALNTTTNNLINNSNQEILINQNGLRGRTFDPATGLYDPTQVWLTSSVLAFSDNGFQTSKLALGSVDTPSGIKFGLVAEVIVGELIAGNNLTIKNDNNSFIVDAFGATLYNAKLTIESDLNTSRIIIDPSSIEPFTIEKKSGATYTKNFWVNSSGDVNMTGSIIANSGSLGGWSISSSGISDAYGNYIRSNGQIKLGGLEINGTSAKFSGDIYADRLIGAVSWTQLTDIPADKITTGTMNGARISGGTASLAGINTVGSDLAVSGNLSVSGGAILSKGNMTTNEGVFYTNVGYYMAGYAGITLTRTISTPSGDRVLAFKGGICTSFV